MARHWIINWCFAAIDERGALGYEMLRAEDIDGAIAVFTKNTDLFPESANVWDSLAEAYMTAGNNELAIKYYEASLERNPRNQNAIEMLERLRDEP